MYVYLLWKWMLHRKEIKNNRWVTVNKDIWSRLRWFTNHFTSDEATSENPWQIISRMTKKFVIHGNAYISLFLTRGFMSWTHNTAKTIVDRSFRHCRQGRTFLTEHSSPQLICDVTRTLGTGIVTWYSSIVLARANLWKAKFTSEQQPRISISHHPVFPAWRVTITKL